jgi:uncharacterized protein YjbJ (UPF0337 family)
VPQPSEDFFLNSEIAAGRCFNPSEAQIRGTGAADAAAGAVKDAAGKMRDDKKLQAEGKMDKAKGEARQALGDAKDAAKHVRIER